jgi:uncharacterized protein (TIGR02118 family)
MTVKLVVLYPTPEDPAAFDAHYRDTHIPIVQRFPGVQRVEVAKVTAPLSSRAGEWYQISEMHFADAEAMNAAFASDAGKESAEDLRSFAPKGVQMFVAEVTEAG